MLTDLHCQLETLGYPDPIYRPLPHGRVAFIKPLIFTSSICIARTHILDEGFNEMYDYHSLIAAKAALEAWDIDKDPEPSGWHRHSPSGRRRPDGTAASERIAA